MNKSVSKAVPIVVVEEHHEAFYVWNYAVRSGWLQPRGYTLLHVDSHPDMMLPRLRRPLASIDDLVDLAAFTYRELEISNFIWPAVYQGYFKRYVWIKHVHRLCSGGWRTIAIQAKNDSATEFTLTPQEGLRGSCSPDAQVIEYTPATTSDTIKTDHPFVLDVDLDFFCCNEYPQPIYRELEITKSSFEEIIHNRYQCLRVSPGDKVSVREKDGRYFLLYNDYEPTAVSSDRDRTFEIATRMEDLLSALDRSRITPELIVICRSFYSGYTPRRYCNSIQETFLSRLRERYEVMQFSIDDILPASPESCGAWSCNLDAAAFSEWTGR